MASPADRQVEANATLDELARSIAEVAAQIHPAESDECWNCSAVQRKEGIDRWENMEHEERDRWRSGVRLLIQEGTLIPPKPKSTGPAPMDGQASIDDAGWTKPTEPPTDRVPGLPPA